MAEAAVGRAAILVNHARHQRGDAEQTLLGLLTGIDIPGDTHQTFWSASGVALHPTARLQPAHPAVGKHDAKFGRVLVPVFEGLLERVVQDRMIFGDDALEQFGEFPLATLGLEPVEAPVVAR